MIAIQLLSGIRCWQVHIVRGEMVHMLRIEGQLNELMISQLILLAFGEFQYGTTNEPAWLVYFVVNLVFHAQMELLLSDGNVKLPSDH